MSENITNLVSTNVIIMSCKNDKCTTKWKYDLSRKDASYIPKKINCRSCRIKFLKKKLVDLYNLQHKYINAINREKLSLDLINISYDTLNNMSKLLYNRDRLTVAYLNSLNNEILIMDLERKINEIWNKKILQEQNINKLIFRLNQVDMIVYLKMNELDYEIFRKNKLRTLT